MNRRTFLKLTGITAMALTTPTIAKPGQTPIRLQWICAKNILPKVGKEVIVKVTGGFKKLEIIIGKVSKATGAAVSEKNQGVYLTPEYSYSESRKGTNLYEKGYIASLNIKIDIGCCSFYSDEKERAKEDKEIERIKQEKLKRIENSEWMKKETRCDIMLGSYSRYIFDGDNSKVHWMLINKEIPKRLPIKVKRTTVDNDGKITDELDMHFDEKDCYQ